MNVYVNLRYSFLFISFLVIPLFKKCDDFDLFLAYLVIFFFFFAIRLTNRAIYIRFLNQNLNRVPKEKRNENSESSQRFLALRCMFVTQNLHNFIQTIAEGQITRSKSEQECPINLLQHIHTHKIKYTHTYLNKIKSLFKKNHDLFNSLHKKWSFPLWIFPVIVQLVIIRLLTRWDSPTWGITIWVIDDGMLISICLVEM